MIRLLGKIPEHITVACSGGVDSMAMLSFLGKRHKVTAAFFHHGTGTCEKAQELVKDATQRMGMHLVFRRIETLVPPRGLSQEEHWRNERYRFLESLVGTVATAHHLNDQVETWLWGSCHGTPKLIPYRRNNIIRPFLLVEKSELERYCRREGVEWLEDASNQDVRHRRNLVRKEMVPVAQLVNPGIAKVIRKKVLQQFEKETNPSVV